MRAPAPGRLEMAGGARGQVVRLVKRSRVENDEPIETIRHDAVLSLNNDVALHQEGIDFSFSVWQAFPHRIVGFPSRVRLF